MSKMNKVLLLGLVAVGLSTSALAVEPKKDRAVIAHLNAHLLLPDESTLSVDMSMDCGSQYENTGVIISSDGGAQLMAVAYATLWGKAAGQSILDTWNNKVSKGDPRKPTFIIVSPPSDADYWSKFNGESLVKVPMKKMMRSTSVESARLSITNDAPSFFAACGTISHDDPQ